MKKVLVVGNGFVASHLPSDYNRTDWRVYPAGFNIENLLITYKPDVLINAIGFCGSPNIDQCEVEKVKTNEANTLIPIMLANECEKQSVQLVHIGSGCVFCGENPGSFSEMGEYFDSGGWKETDFANPASYYARTKYATDLVLEQISCACILRIRMPISSKNHPRNLINKLRGYKQIIDIPNSMTFMSDLVRCIAWVIEKEVRGIYNVVNPEPTSAKAIMEAYQSLIPEHQFEVISEKQLDALTKAKRSNCILNGAKLKEAGFHMTPTRTALELCMQDYIADCNKPVIDQTKQIVQPIEGDA